MADPQITPRRALALLATVADNRDVLEADSEAGQLMTPKRRLSLMALVSDCEDILESERLRQEAAEMESELATRRPGRSALAPEQAK